MTQDELAVMDGGKCIFMLRGVRPFLSDKYDLTKHPDYKYTADADKKYLFDMERYMKRKPAIVKPDEPFEMYPMMEAASQGLTEALEGVGFMELKIPYVTNVPML